MSRRKSSDKSIALIGNPGVGKTTFVIASLHHLDKIGWARVQLDDLPREYGGLVDQLISGQPLSPTLRLGGYGLQFTNIEYRGSTLKMGWFGKVKLEVTDMSGEDYRSGNIPFRECVGDAFAALLLIDPSRSDNLAESLAGQIAPLFNAIKYISGKECKIKYLGLVFTKRFLHKHKLKDIAGFISEQLGPILSIADRAKIDINLFEIDSRGKDGRLDPKGIEQVYYDTLSYVSKLKGTRAEISGTMDDTQDVDEEEEELDLETTPAAPEPTEDLFAEIVEESVDEPIVEELVDEPIVEELVDEPIAETIGAAVESTTPDTSDETSDDEMEEKFEFHKTVRLED